MNEILDKIKEIVVDQLGVDEDVVTPDATFLNDLEADSLDVVELMMALEEEFDIEIPDEEAEKISTVSDLANYIAEKQQYKYAEGQMFFGDYNLRRVKV